MKAKLLAQWRALNQVSSSRLLSLSIGVIVAIRILGLLVHPFFPVSSPHIWRQVDTMGVALRYGLRLAVEKTDFSWWLPAIIDSAGTRGIMPMEFPLLNILGGLGFWIAGSNVDLGRSLALFIAEAFTLSMGLLSFLVWRRSDAPRPFVIAALLSPFMGFAALFTGKFMPDVAAMLLVLAGAGLVWGGSWFAVILIGLGVLMKPTAVVTVFILFLHSDFRQKIVSFAAKVICGLIPAAAWYLAVVPWLKTSVETELAFTFHSGLKPWEGVWKFWTSGGVWEAIEFHSWFQGGLLLIFVAAFYSRKRLVVLKSLFLTTGVLLLQGTAIGALSGDHCSMHAYYLMGLTPTAGLLLVETWELLPSNFWRLILTLGMALRSAEASMFDMSGMWKADAPPKLWASCKALRDRHQEIPWHQGVDFRTTVEEYPILGLCLGEKSESPTGSHGLFRKGELLPNGCRQLDEEQGLVLAHCDR